MVKQLRETTAQKKRVTRSSQSKTIRCYTESVKEKSSSRVQQDSDYQKTIQKKKATLKNTRQQKNQSSEKVFCLKNINNVKSRKALIQKQVLIKKYQHQQQYKSLTVQLLCVLDKFRTPSQYLVPTCTKFQALQNNLIGKTNLIIGNHGCGKTSMVRWANKQQAKLIQIDCYKCRTHTQFVFQLTKAMGKDIQQLILGPQMVIKNDINFNKLNQIIFRSKQKFIIVLKQVQLYAAQRPRQVIFYVLLQWMRTNIVSHLGIVMCTTKVTFDQSLDKRIASRMTATVHYLPHITPFMASQIIVRRISILKEKSKHYKVLSKLESAFQSTEIVAEALSQGVYPQKNTIKSIMRNGHRSIVYYLDLFKSVFLQEQWLEQKSILTMEPIEIADHIYKCILKLKNINYCPFAMAKIRIINSTFPQMVIMALIRIKLLQQLSLNELRDITFKKLYSSFMIYTKESFRHNIGTAHDYNIQILLNAVKSLCLKKVIFVGPGDKYTRKIVSHVGPQHLKECFNSIANAPDFLKALFELKI